MDASWAVFRLSVKQPVQSTEERLRVFIHAHMVEVDRLQNRGEFP